MIQRENWDEESWSVHKCRTDYITLLGLVQGENAGPLFRITDDFKSDSRILNQAQVTDMKPVLCM